MFSTLKQRLLLAIYIFILLSIPVGAYLASETQVFQSRAKEETPTPKTSPRPTLPPIASPGPIADLSNLLDTPDVSGESIIESPTIANSFGPTLSLKVALEGRKENNQSTKLFIGIVEGALTSNPKFLLSFTVDLPQSGEYANLSLAGLSPGSQYTALLKGAQQIAAASEFNMSPTVTSLNSGQIINLISGDLNEDNVIDAKDLDIALTGAAQADINKDGVVNSFDLAIIIKNTGQAGASGAWTSPLPQTATSSGSLGAGSSSGYWIWVPVVTE